MIINNYDRVKIKPVCTINTKETLKEIKELVPVLENYKWCITAGTCLGLYRDNCLIPHDTDFDIEIYNSNQKEIKKLNSILLTLGLKNCRTMIDKKNRYSQLAYYLSNGFIFDIYFYYDEDKDYYINYNDIGILKMPKKFIEHTYIKDKLRYPQKIEEYLKYRFGKDWKIPTKKKQGWGSDAGEALQRK